MRRELLLGVLSWEERCPLAFIELFAKKGFMKALYLADNRYVERTDASRKKIEDSAFEFGVQVQFLYTDFDDQIIAYRAIRQAIKFLDEHQDFEITLDISTGPRGIIWMTLSMLQGLRTKIDLWYFPAETYGSWQTREDQDPKLVLNRSGIMYPDKPTCLVLLCGTEISRAEKLFYKFEPRRTFILRDTNADSFGKVQMSDPSLRGRVIEMPFDQKDTSDKNLEVLLNLVGPLLHDYNILCGSFGPKLGAILLYRLATNFESVGLSYVPAGEHNVEMSRGIGPGINYEFVFDCLLSDAIEHEDRYLSAQSRED